MLPSTSKKVGGGNLGPKFEKSDDGKNGDKKSGGSVVYFSHPGLFKSLFNRSSSISRFLLLLSLLLSFELVGKTHSRLAT